MADAHLVRGQRRQGDVAQLKHLRAAMTFDDDSLRARSRRGRGNDLHPRRGHDRRHRRPLSRQGSGGRRFAAQHAPHGREPGLIYALGDKADQFIAAMGWWVEAGTPFPEGGVAVGDRLQPDRGHIAHQRQRRLQQAVVQPALLVRQCQQLLAQFSAVGQPEAAHGTYRIDGIPALDLAEGDGRMPAVVAVEVPQDRPDIADGGVDDRAAADFHHQPIHPTRFARSSIIRPEVSGRIAA